jgi:N6-adenosine-specific RNA methylase IME4
MSDKKYKIIYADPPWSFSNKKTGGSMKSGAEHNYPTMTIEDLKSMDVGSITSKDAVLIMWWVGSMPQEALDLVSAWGFKVKNMNGFVWKKLTVKLKNFFGMGFYTRAGSESAIIAVKGKPKVLSHSVRAVLDSPARKHSQKPDEFRSLIVEMLGDLPRLEMFARESAEGWDVFGNEVASSINMPTKTIGAGGKIFK